jgi:NYN domain
LVTVSDNTAKLAVLIDADNAQPGIVEELLAEIAKYGTAHVKRAYGDWTGPALKGWKCSPGRNRHAYEGALNSCDARIST